MDNCGRCEVWHSIGPDMRPNIASGNDANILLAFLALIMQIFGARSPRLDPPHSRTTIIMILFVILFMASRCPHDIFELMNIYGNNFEYRANMSRHLAGGSSEETEMVLDCMV